MTQNPNYENFRDGRTSKDFTYTPAYKQAVAQIGGRYYDTATNQWYNTGSEGGNYIPSSDTASKQQSLYQAQLDASKIKETPSPSNLFHGADTTIDGNVQYYNTPSWSDIDTYTGEHTGRWEYRNTGLVNTPEGTLPPARSGAYSQVKYRNVERYVVDDIDPVSGQKIGEHYAFKGDYNDVMGTQYIAQSGEQSNIFGQGGWTYERERDVFTKPSEYEAQGTGELNYERETGYNPATSGVDWWLPTGLTYAERAQGYGYTPSAFASKVKNEAQAKRISEAMEFRSFKPSYSDYAHNDFEATALTLYIPQAKTHEGYTKQAEWNKSELARIINVGEISMPFIERYGDESSKKEFAQSVARTRGSQFVYNASWERYDTAYHENERLIAEDKALLARSPIRQRYNEFMDTYIGKDVEEVGWGSTTASQRPYWLFPKSESSRQLWIGTMGGVAYGIPLATEWVAQTGGLPLVAMGASWVGGIGRGVGQLASGDLGGVWTGIGQHSAGVMVGVALMAGTPKRAGFTIGTTTAGYYYAGMFKPTVNAGKKYSTFSKKPLLREGDKLRGQDYGVEIQEFWKPKLGGAEKLVEIRYHGLETTSEMRSVFGQSQLVERATGYVYDPVRDAWYNANTGIIADKTSMLPAIVGKSGQMVKATTGQEFVSFATTQNKLTGELRFSEAIGRSRDFARYYDPFERGGLMYQEVRGSGAVIKGTQIQGWEKYTFTGKIYDMPSATNTRPWLYWKDASTYAPELWTQGYSAPKVGQYFYGGQITEGAGTGGTPLVSFKNPMITFKDTGGSGGSSIIFKGALPSIVSTPKPITGGTSPFVISLTKEASNMGFGGTISLQNQGLLSQFSTGALVGFQTITAPQFAVPLISHIAKGAGLGSSLAQQPIRETTILNVPRATALGGGTLTKTLTLTRTTPQLSTGLGLRSSIDLGVAQVPKITPRLTPELSLIPRTSTALRMSSAITTVQIPLTVPVLQPLIPNPPPPTGGGGGGGIDIPKPPLRGSIGGEGAGSWAQEFRLRPPKRVYSPSLIAKEYGITLSRGKALQVAGGGMGIRPMLGRASVWGKAPKKKKGSKGYAFRI